MYVNGHPLFCTIIGTTDKGAIGHGTTVTRDTATNVDHRVPVVHHKDYFSNHCGKAAADTITARVDATATATYLH
jgi:hypothetical protein